MRNRILYPADIINLTAPAAVASGQPLLVGNLFGVVGNAAASGEPMDFALRGVFALPKAAAAAFAEGDAVAWDDTAKAVDELAAGRFRVGVAVAVAAVNATGVNVRLDGVSVEAIA